MAAKKTTKKTAESAPATPETASAKKAVKVAKKAVAKKAVAKKAVEPETTPAPAATAAPAPASAGTVVKKVATKPSLDVIARAAYLNYRRRVEQGLPGDSHGDWLEAELQFSERPGR